VDSDIAQNSRHSSRWLALGEIIGVVGLIEVYLWFLKGTSYKFSKNLVVVSIVALVGISIWNHRHELPEKASIARSWGKVLLGSFILAIFLLFGAWAIGVINVDSYSSFWAKLVSDQTWWKRKFGTVVVQQVALQLCLLPACLSLCKNKWLGVSLAALLFGLIHSPNPYLMLITASAGFFWCWTYPVFWVAVSCHSFVRTCYWRYWRESIATMLSITCVWVRKFWISFHKRFGRRQVNRL